VPYLVLSQEDKMDDQTITTYASVALIPTIIGILGAAKRFFPSAHDNVWFGLSLLLGVVGQLLVFSAINGFPSDFAGILALILLGISFGLAAGKAYDETKSRREA
jgi:uncharacterized membrane protein